MSGKEIIEMVSTIGVFGCIQIYILFAGIAKIIKAIKGGNVNINEYEQCNKDENELNNKKEV